MANEKITKVNIRGTEYDIPGNVTGVKGNSESTYRTGDINITKSNIGLGSVRNEDIGSTDISAIGADVKTAIKNLNDNKSATTHTHTLTIASDTGTNQLTLAASTKYKLTAGGSSYIFTTPPNTTYSSKAAASGGTDVSLVTTGEKYTWNNKSDLALGTTATTAAKGNHTHTTTIAADSGTNALTLAASTKYKLTAGGSTFIFTTPPNTTYSSKTAASGGTEVSLVTTGEKYTWNNKSNLTIGTTASTAAAGNHTHSVATKSAAGFCPALANDNQNNKWLRQDGTWVAPPDTNTWRGIQNNLTSTSTSDSLSANMGRILAEENTWYGTSSTAAATAAKEGITTNGKFVLKTGAKVSVKFTYGNVSSNMTLNVDQTGAKAIKAYGTTNPVIFWGPGDIVEFTYDGTNWIMGATSQQITYLDRKIASIGNILTKSGSVTGTDWETVATLTGLNSACTYLLWFHVRVTSGSGHIGFVGTSYEEGQFVTAASGASNREFYCVPVSGVTAISCICYISGTATLTANMNAILLTGIN